MSEQVTLKLNNVSQCTTKLPAQITQHEIGDCKEKKETKFGDYFDNFLYGFCLWYISHFSL